jgi:hypothetical protein
MSCVYEAKQVIPSFSVHFQATLHGTLNTTCLLERERAGELIFTLINYRSEKIIYFCCRRRLDEAVIST